VVNRVEVHPHVQKWANVALERMLRITAGQPTQAASDSPAVA